MLEAPIPIMLEDLFRRPFKESAASKDGKGSLASSLESFLPHGSSSLQDEPHIALRKSRHGHHALH